MKIIDCFTFYNEIDLLYYRLSILYEHVDYFIIVEANQTFSGKEKSLYYLNNIHLFEKFKDKIIHIVVNLPFKYPNIDYHKNEQWINEKYQRNSINNGIKKLSLNNDDLIIISDLDEIPNPNILIQIKDNKIKINDGKILQLDMYYYNLYSKHHDKWYHSKIVSYNTYIKTTPEAIRHSKIQVIENAGWHLSYFGDANFISNKIKNFSHQEFNSETYTDNDKIQNRINKSSDLFGRNYVPIKRIELNDNNNLPILYDIYLSKYCQLNKVIPLKPVYIYIHICILNNWKDIVDRLYFKIKNSGLYNIIKEIRISILGDYINNKDFEFFNDIKSKIIYQSTDISLHEKITINKLYEDCSNEDFYVLYLHSKGVEHFKENIKNINDWVDYLSFLNIYKYDKCIGLLNNNSDTVGCNLQISNDYPLHYSGNFWWSKQNKVLFGNTKCF